jgi:hypothetical protein
MAASAAPPDVIGLVEDVAQAHGLSFSGQRHVLSAVLGWRGGNRDADLYRLGMLMAKAAGGSEATSTWLCGLLLPEGAGGWRDRDRALLDLVVTIAMEARDDGMDSMDRFLDELAVARRLPTDEAVARALVSALARVVHAFRRRVLPEARLHNVFVAVRGVLGDRVPLDGDAMTLWEQAGTRTLLTRYDSALIAAIDYAEAQVVAASWARPVSQEALADLAATTDATTDSVPMRADAQSNLIDALDAIAAFPIKLLKRSEIEILAQLGAHGRWAGRWPRSAIGAQALGPSQGRITQDLRRPSGRPLGALLPSVGRGAFVQVKSELAQLLETVMDAVFVVASLLPEEDPLRKGLARSKADPQRDKRIAALARRKSYREALDAFPVENMAAQAHAILGPLSLVRTHVASVVESWSKLDANTLTHWEETDTQRHRSKLMALYSEDFAAEVRSEVAND